MPVTSSGKIERRSARGNRGRQAARCLSTDVHAGRQSYRLLRSSVAVGASGKGLDSAEHIFVQIAEEMGIVTGITRFMLNQACRDCATWPQSISVSVNLSAQDLRSKDIVAMVMEALDASGLEPSRLHLEVTESCLMDELTTVRSILADLRAKGITIAIDDFGTGFSSLSYLDSLPVDIVKIDRSFVRDITNDSRRFKLAVRHRRSLKGPQPRNRHRRCGDAGTTGAHRRIRFGRYHPGLRVFSSGVARQRY